MILRGIGKVEFSQPRLLTNMKIYLNVWVVWTFSAKLHQIAEISQIKLFPLTCDTDLPYNRSRKENLLHISYTTSWHFLNENNFNFIIRSYKILLALYIQADIKKCLEYSTYNRVGSVIINMILHLGYTSFLPEEKMAMFD